MGCSGIRRELPLPALPAVRLVRQTIQVPDHLLARSVQRLQAGIDLGGSLEIGIEQDGDDVAAIGFQRDRMLRDPNDQSS